MFLSGLIVRLLSGEEVFSIPPIIKWPGFDEETETQRFPFKTTIMLINLCTLYERHYKTYVKVKQFNIVSSPMALKRVTQGDLDKSTIKAALKTLNKFYIHPREHYFMTSSAV